MSVTFSLYKVSEAEYLGSVFEAKTTEERDNEIRRRLNLPADSDIEATLQNACELVKAEWSDGAYHRMLDIADKHWMWKGERGWRRMDKRLKTLPTQVYKGHKYVALDKVEYSQGWFLKKRFFKKRITTVYCVTKKQMMDFFKQYLDYSGDDCLVAKDVMERFERAWKDGMLFECSW